MIIADAYLTFDGLQKTLGPLFGILVVLLCLYWMACLILIPIAIMGISSRMAKLTRQMSEVLSEIRAARSQQQQQVNRSIGNGR